MHFAIRLFCTMGLKDWIARKWGHRVVQRHAADHQQAAGIQQNILHQLLINSANTAFGHAHHFAKINSTVAFQEHVPVRDYEAAKSWFDLVEQGRPNVLWPGKPLYLAKTSGTTSGAKYIPITRASIGYQVQAARDLLLMHCYRCDTAFLHGKMLFLSGSPELHASSGGIRTGRLSGIVNHFVPAYLRRSQIPDWETNCIEDWETKLDRIVEQAIRQDLRLISGIPPWVQMFFEHAENAAGKKIREIWPNLSLYVMGGVDFTPYRQVLLPYFPETIAIQETFPASEGFFALDDSTGAEGMLLNIRAGIYYEFIPVEEYGAPNALRLGLSQVQTDRQYAMVISTNAGLWAYDLGDTVRFTSLSPYRVKVTGRVKHFISTFGEHVISEEVNQAMVLACANTYSEIVDFTVAPQVRSASGASCHEWLVEFMQPPADLEIFTRELDIALQDKNAYYKDLRRGNILKVPEVKILKRDAIREFMKSEGRLGGQNKFPRLTNNRVLADRLYAYLRPA